MSSTNASALRSRSIFVSDVHLGFDGCSAERLLAFLRAIETETLYLVGDIIDLACASSALAWPLAHHEVLREIFLLAQLGTRVVYIPGNHDCLLRDLDGVRFGNIEIRRRATHVTADGRRFLVLHGDEIEGSSRPWLEALGGRAYGALLGLDRQLNTLSAPLGLPSFAIAASLKQAVKSSLGQRAAFERAVLAAAQDSGVDGLICGHTHRPELVDLEGVLYCNDGDWVESCTALIEDFSGELSLVRWREDQTLSSISERSARVEKAA